MSILNTDRDLDKLNKDFRAKVDKFLEEAPQIFVTEAYRTQERQDYLYSIGRTRTRNSNHTKGLAIDVAFRGSVLYPKEHWKWEEVAEVARRNGIDWGYDLWAKYGFIDKPHFQDNGIPLEVKEPLVQEAIDKGYYNGIEGDGVTDRTVLLCMKMVKGETGQS